MDDKQIAEAVEVANVWNQSQTRPGTPGWGREVDALILLSQAYRAQQARIKALEAEIKRIRDHGYALCPRVPELEKAESESAKYKKALNKIAEWKLLPTYRIAKQALASREEGKK